MAGNELLFSNDSATGLRTWFSSSEENGGTWTFRHEQDASPILDYNKEMQANGFDKGSELWHAAKIPALIIYEWMHKYGVNIYDKNHKDGVKRLLNHPDYRYLRVQNFIL